MNTCPACGDSLGDGAPVECPHCHTRIQGATESFDAVPAPGAQPGDLKPHEALAGDTPALVVRKGVETGERFVIDRGRISIGRDPSCDIFLNDVTVSRSHAVLTRSSAEVSIEDSGSLNGTYVNGVRVDKAVLGSGDIVQVGMFQMVFVGGAGSGQA